MLPKPPFIIYGGLQKQSSFTVHQTMLCHLLELRAGTSVIGIRINGDASARGEDTRHLNILRVHQMNEVFHYDVHAILVESTMIAEAEQVEFQTLALYHLDIGDIANTDFRKVRLPRDGTEAGEFGAVETHPVVIAGMLVIKCLQYFGGIVLTVFCLSPKRESWSFNSVIAIYF